MQCIFFYKIYTARNEVKSTSEFKYLGVIISSNVTISRYVGQIYCSFLAHLHSMYHKINFITLDSLRFIFFSLCYSLHGGESWFNQISRLNSLKKVSVAYHKAVKREFMLKVWDGNHLACYVVDTNIFKCSLLTRCIKFFDCLIAGIGQCIRPLQQYFLLQSKFVQKLRRVIQVVY